MAYFRHPETFNEKRQSFACDDDNSVCKVRSKRKSHSLPSDWSDLRKSNEKERSWKQYRKTKWKMTDS